MDTIDAVNYVDLKKKVGAIPVKVIIVAALMYFLYGNSDSEYRLSTVSLLVMGMLIYTMLSIFWWFVCATGNWLVGIIVGVVALVGLFWGVEHFFHDNELVQLIFVGVLFLGGIILDVVRVIRLIALRRKER